MWVGLFELLQGRCKEVGELKSARSRVRERERIDVDDCTDVVVRGAEESYLETAITSNNWRVDEVGLEVWFVYEGNRVWGDVGMVVVFGTSCLEVMVMWMARVCDGDTWFLEAEDVNGAIFDICEYRGKVIGFGDIVGA